MSDYLGDTPSMARMYCPGCEPDADAEREILDVRWCGVHQPQSQGVDDHAVVTPAAYISGSNESGGDDNRRWCEMFHRKSRP